MAFSSGELSDTNMIEMKELSAPDTMEMKELSDTNVREKLLGYMQQIKEPWPNASKTDRIVTHNVNGYLEYNYALRGYTTQQREQYGWLLERQNDNKPLTAGQVAFLQWKWHHLHAACCRAMVDGISRAGDGTEVAFECALPKGFSPCFGEQASYDPTAFLESSSGGYKAQAEAQAAKHKVLAQRWLIVCVALTTDGCIDADTDVINKRAVWEAISHPDTIAAATWDESFREELQHHADAYKRYLGRIIPITACVLAALACGASMYAMSLLMPSILSAAGHWIMLGIAAVSGAAVTGYDYQKASQWSWMRALCLVLVLGAVAAAAYALSHVVLPLMVSVAVLNGSASVIAAASSGFTLLTLCGVGLLASHALPEAGGLSQRRSEQEDQVNRPVEGSVGEVESGEEEYPSIDDLNGTGPRESGYGANTHEEEYPPIDDFNGTGPRESGHGVNTH